ncbi:MAG: virulence RhuM family protein [Bacilli bacterium]|nr:virulence RhuM family protein [Bacilli bacterium]MDD4282439.1 virulence RhuM family protein [Bacilli bacterium]MDD4718910.1 virulence RhuM family protein [Bacilli bacterium]
MEKDLIIRSSTAEFLIFKTQEKEQDVQVKYKNENLWLTQKSMAELFDCSSDNISLHLKNIFSINELDKKTVTEEFSATGSDGKNYKTKFYNLDAVIAVGYRVNSLRATQFRRWATSILKTFTIQGYVLDKERMKNGSFIDKDYFEKLLEEIREIRLSERRFYQKITDIYATSIDYDSKSPISIDFFKKVQNKMHYAVSNQTAAELIYNRTDSKKNNMGLTNWKNSPKGKIMQSDVIIAKNYLNKDEIEDLERIVSAFLELAEGRAKRSIPMTMEDWATRIDKHLLSDDRNILKDAGKISHKIACDKALVEFEKYRIKQDKLYKSDFDLLIEESSGNYGT